MSVPLNANELLLPAQGAELQELVSFYLTHTCTERFKHFQPFMFKPESDKDGETQEEVTTLVGEFMKLMCSYLLVID